MKRIIAVVLFLLMSPTLFAQDIAGIWSANVDTPQGPSNFIFEFTASGNSFSGTMSNAFMGLNQISEGALSGNNVSFKVTVDGGPVGEMVMNYRGSLSDNTLDLVGTFEGTPPPGAPAEQKLTARKTN